MSKNTIHNFNLSIQNSAEIQNSEHLTETIIKELAKVSNELSQQKDIAQLWQEQQDKNASLNVSNFSTEGGATETFAKNKEAAQSVSNTPSVSGKAIESTTNNGSRFIEKASLTTTSTFSAPIGEGVTDTTGGTIFDSSASVSTTSPILGVENDLNSELSSQVYSNVSSQEVLSVPQAFHTNSNEPTIEAVKAEIKKKLEEAINANDTEMIKYWTRIDKAFDEETKLTDFENELAFLEMYKALKQSQLSSVEIQNFNWEIVREKMIQAIDANILKGSISKENKIRWGIIKKQLADDKTNVANLFERYDELFLLLKEVEGLDALPNSITITTKTKIYPNLSNPYANIGKEDVYVFLKRSNNVDVPGSSVKSGAVKIKNSNETSFIVGESLEFFLDETLIKEGKDKKENINWIIYKDSKKLGTEFIDKGTSFTYNFDAPGTYIVEAYGSRPGANKKATASKSAFIKLSVIAQEILITPPVSIKNRLGRPSVEAKLFKVSLKNPEIKTLNPVKLYYQVVWTNEDKTTVVSKEQELDSTGIIKLMMQSFGEYAIKIASKDQYGLIQNQTFRTIKNFVESIDILTLADISNDVYFWDETSRDAIFAAKSFKIEATPQERENVKWLVYEENGKTYIPDGFKLQTENNEGGIQYLAKGETFIFPIPKKEGVFIVEAYSNIMEGLKSKSIKKIYVKYPKVTEASWTYTDGSKKRTSGFTGEMNTIKASIPGYGNQPVRIKFFLNDSREVNYYNDTKTDGNGEINKKLKFDNVLQKHFGIQKGKTAKIRFELEGIKNGKSYPFKKDTNVYDDAVLNVVTAAKITDAYFVYEGNRVSPFSQVPYGSKVTGVVKTLNMVGKEVVLKVYKDFRYPKHSVKVIVDNEGTATINFTLNEKWQEISIMSGLMDMFYIAMVGVESKLYSENGLNAVLSNLNLKEKVAQVQNQDTRIEEARIRAFLRMIRVGEGTITTKGYEKVFGGSSFIDDHKKTWEDHPGIVIRAKGKDSKGREKTYFSSASGAYQVKKDIWDWGKKFREFYDIKDFSPESQDKFALIILKHKRGKDVIRLIRENKIEDAVKLCQGEWASLPDSPHGQPTVTWQTVMTEYNKFLKEELEGKSPLSIKSGFLKDFGYGDDQSKEIINDVTLKFSGSSADRADLSFKTINVLKEVASASKNFEIKITSTKRETYDQARIMYENCESTGGKYQRDQVYGKIGDQVIEVYIREAEIGKKEREVVIKKMEEKIIELDPENVSKHLGDYIFLETFDIQFSGLPNPRDFKKEFLKRKELDHILYEPKNNCYHIQINQ